MTIFLSNRDAVVEQYYTKSYNRNINTCSLQICESNLIQERNYLWREWEDLAPMGIPRIQPGVAMLSGRIYAVGGEQGSQILANGEVYDPQVTSIS